MHETSLTTLRRPGKPLLMGRPKQYDERIQLTLVEGTTGRVDALLAEGEYRLDFIRTAIEAEIEKRSTGAKRKRRTSAMKRIDLL